MTHTSPPYDGHLSQSIYFDKLFFESIKANGQIIQVSTPSIVVKLPWCDVRACFLNESNSLAKL